MPPSIKLFEDATYERVLFSRARQLTPRPSVIPTGADLLQFGTKENQSISTGAFGLLPMHFAATFEHTECGSGTKILAGVVDGPVVNALHVAAANCHDSSARAICNSTVRTLDFRGWSPCDGFKTRGAVLRWMYVEVSGQY